ncbi:hypothetical protein CHS0354_021790 [Potamilus streckersoni]|uniref:Apple domain-containing protein n=1 Tax=Potamilus streckersoni TaxID=2493646 RepID=A0AAE0S3V2_9BIVA|nr:hypothetical protein CHS0354_021790 [Potamilus streckersoni]
MNHGELSVEVFACKRMVNLVITFARKSFKKRYINLVDSFPVRDISHFTAMRNHAVLQNIGYTQTTLAVDDCATACILEETFECKSYTYCYNTAMCYLINIHPDKNSTMIQSSTSCDLYTSMMSLQLLYFPCQNTI